MSQRLIDWEKILYPSVIYVANKIIETIPDDGVLFDVGANTGLVTKIVLKAKPNIRAYLFEPVEEYADYCKDFFKDNKNIVVENIALSNIEGFAEVITHPGNLGYNRIVVNEKGSVFTTTLSNYVKDALLTRIDFIKIDVEGHEVEVVEGMFKFLNGSDHLPSLLIETGWHTEREFAMITKLCEEYSYEKKDNIHSDIFLQQKLKNETKL